METRWGQRRSGRKWRTEFRQQGMITRELGSEMGDVGEQCAPQGQGRTAAGAYKLQVAEVIERAEEGGDGD